MCVAPANLDMLHNRVSHGGHWLLVWVSPWVPSGVTNSSLYFSGLRRRNWSSRAMFPAKQESNMNTWFCCEEWIPEASETEDMVHEPWESSPEHQATPPRSRQRSFPVVAGATGTVEAPGVSRKKHEPVRP